MPSDQTVPPMSTDPKERSVETVVVAQHLRAPAVLAEDPVVLRPTLQLTTMCESGLFWTRKALHTHDAETCVGQTHVHIK